MRKTLFRAGGAMLIALALPLASTPEANAISFSSRMSNGKVCRTNFGIEAHVHAANGAHPDWVEAEMKAIHDWMRFTALEYGRRWANWNLAIGHTMTCAHDNDAGVWRCRAEAQPCKT